MCCFQMRPSGMDWGLMVVIGAYMPWPTCHKTNALLPDVQTRPSETDWVGVDGRMVVIGAYMPPKQMRCFQGPTKAGVTGRLRGLHAMTYIARTRTHVRSV